LDATGQTHIRTWVYERIEKDGSRTRLGAIEDPYNSKLTDVDAYFQKETGLDPANFKKNKIVVWFWDTDGDGRVRLADPRRDEDRKRMEMPRLGVADDCEPGMGRDVC
jgi:hypothetical protein